MSHVLSFTIAFTKLHAKLTFVNSFYIGQEMVGENRGDLPRTTPLDGEVCITKSFRTETEIGTGTGRVGCEDVDCYLLLHLGDQEGLGPPKLVKVSPLKGKAISSPRDR